MITLFMHINYLKIKDVSDILGFNDNRATKKWLKLNNVPISKIGGKIIVCQFTFELKRQQIEVEKLRNSYPTKWFEIYEANTSDKGMVKAIRELYPEVKNTKKITPKTKRYIL